MVTIPHQLVHRLWVASSNGAGWPMGTLWLDGGIEGGMTLTDGVIPVALVMGAALLWRLLWPRLAQGRVNWMGSMTVQDNLQETAERLNLALSAAQMGSWDWNLDQQTQFWSPQSKRILGLDPETSLQRLDQWQDFIHPDDWPATQTAVEQALATQQDFTHQYRVRWPDGSWHWVSLSGRAVAQGRSQRLVGVLQDITDRKQAELYLRASEARFRAVFEQAAVGMARLSPEGRWIQVNQGLCDILGRPAEALLGHHFSEVTDEADQSQDEVYYQQLIQGEQRSCQFEKRYLHGDGHPVWTLVTVSVESDESEDITALIAIIEDITERKAAREELLRRAEELANTNLMLARTTALLERRNSELDQFAYVTSHDLKAPLRAISNLADWIGEDLAGQIPAENQRQLALLKSRVQRMEALINGLLEYARIGRRERQITQVNVAQLLHSVIDSLAPPPGFQVQVADAMPTIPTHQTALGQVFANLISNALKHHHQDQGRVTIHCRSQGDVLEFCVSDDGPGIAPQYHEKIFTIFQTLKARDDFESTGVGLSVVKKIVESENGRVWLESAVGEGSRFYFTWPMVSG
ncbi:MAG: PAS domain S-box protein [Spirulina sp.]